MALWFPRQTTSSIIVIRDFHDPQCIARFPTWRCAPRKYRGMAKNPCLFHDNFGYIVFLCCMTHELKSICLFNLFQVFRWRTCIRFIIYGRWTDFDLSFCECYVNIEHVCALYQSWRDVRSSACRCSITKYAMVFLIVIKTLLKQVK